VADASVAILDGAGTSRAIDAQTVGTDFQQTVTIGDGVNAGRVGKVEADGSQRVAASFSTASTLTNVTSVASSVTILAANATRRGAIVFNDSTSVLYLSYGVGASSATSFSVRIAAGGVYALDVPSWTGALTGMWAAANGAARVTDLSA
jgi:hypothetical protein